MKPLSTIKHFVLNDKKEPVEVSFEEWAKNYRNYQVEHYEQGNVRVSTIFLGLGDIFGKPCFETMIFGGPLDEYQERCQTYAQALEQHKTAVNLHKASLTERKIKEDE